ncbi:MAG: hypothetical protein JWL79_2089 [Frankiales bacterium]|nr:hypothetical protein [Frankiales bacterium]
MRLRLLKEACVTDHPLDKAIREAVASARRGATVPDIASVIRRGRRRHARMRSAAVAGAAVVATGVVLTATTLLHSSGPPIEAGHSPTSSPPATTARPVEGTPSPVPVTLPSPPTRATSLGSVRATSGPEVPLIVRSGSQLLLPGRTALVIGSAPRATPSCNASYTVSPDASWVAYTSPTGLRTVNVHTRQAYGLGPGCDPVWGPGGLAYLLASPINKYDQYHSELVVRASALGPPSIWAHGQLRPVAWVGQQFVYERTEHPVQYQSLDVMIITAGPGHDRVVSAAKYRNAFVAADARGSRFLIQLDLPTSGPQGSMYVLPELRVLDAATLRTVASLPAQFGKATTGLSAGVWIGNRVYAGEGYSDGGSAHLPPVLYSVSINGARLQLQKLVDLAPNREPLFLAIDQVRAANDGTLAIFRGGGPDPGETLTTCDTAGAHCQDLQQLQP